MRTNIGKIDRLLRIAAGGALFLAFLEGTVVGILALVVLFLGAVMMLTAIVGSCPLYSILGWNTLEK